MQPYPNEPPASFPAFLLPPKVDRTTYRRMLAVRERADAKAHEQKHKTPSGDMAILGEAVAWPLYMGDRKSLLPLGIFGAFAFFGVPFVYPQASLGVDAAVGYATAAGVYFVSNYGHHPVHFLKGNPAR